MFFSCFVGVALFGLACCSATQSYPAIVEFDVVFPRNETYAPTAIMPVVFAIQNPNASIPLRLETQWRIVEPRREGPITFSWINSYLNYSTDPYFVVFGAKMPNNTEGSFSLLWNIESGNCSQGSDKYGGSYAQNNVTFTIGTGGQQPNLLTSSDNGTWCPNQSVTFNITEVVPVQHPLDHDGQSTCAVIAETPPPATPCAIKIDNAIATSLLSSMTAEACDQGILTTGCPHPSEPANKTSTAASIGPNSGSFSMDWIVLVTGSLLSLLFLHVL